MQSYFPTITHLLTLQLIGNQLYFQSHSQLNYGKLRFLAFISWKEIFGKWHLVPLIYDLSNHFPVEFMVSVTKLKSY